jgi:CHAT domain-containing protein
MFLAVARYTALLEAACAAASDRAVAAMHVELRSLLSSVLSCRDFSAERPDWDTQDVSAWLLGRGFSEWRNRRALRAVEFAATDAAFSAEWQALAGLRAAAHRDDGEPATAVQRRIELDLAEAALSRRLAVAPQRDVPRLPGDTVAIVTATYLRAALARQGVPTPPGEEHVAVFLLADGRARRYELGPAAAVADAVAAVRAAAQSAAQSAAQPDRQSTRGRDPGEVAPSAPQGAIAGMLRPMLAAIGPDVRRLVVCPDGALASLPWAALPDGPHGARCLADRLEVTYVDHLASLAAEARSTGAPSLLVLGDADFDAGAEAASTSAATPLAGARRWRALSGTAREADLCARAFRTAFANATATDLRGGEASWAKLERGVRGARFLHLATHGFVADEASWPRAADPMAPAGAVVDQDPLQRTGLVLAGANVGARDGVVTASRLAGLDLSACELAVLACCDSNVGPRAFGDAVSGLHAAVRAAGARSVVSTLWQIPDDDSVRFFELFYAALFADGLPASAAFRRAQEQARSKGLPPRCWAAFVYYGPPG